MTRWTGRILVGLSVTLLIAISVCFVGRWDEVAVITLPPFWAWAIIGILLASGAWRVPGGWTPRLVLVLWVGMVFAFSSDVRRFSLSPLGKGQPWRASTDPSCIRVISLNCASEAKAVEETWSWNPDIVLLQESPPSNEVARICRERLGGAGSYACGLDCSIIVRGQVLPMSNPPSLHFTHVWATLTNQVKAEVVSLRLLPPDIRLDLWNPRCWRQHFTSRQVRRSQLQELANSLAPLSGRRSLIVGGDFNAPEGDAIFRVLQEDMKDTFSAGGVGWGNTAINTCPVSRPDQVWVHRAFTVLRTWVVATRHSDHRMVVCDLVMPSDAARQSWPIGGPGVEPKVLAEPRP